MSSNLLNRGLIPLKNSGSVKITSNGDTTEPSFTLIESSGLQQLIYIDPALDEETYFPETSRYKDSRSLYSDNVGSYNGIFLENPVLGQPQVFRASFNYTKQAGSNAGVVMVLRNPISGFERDKTITLPSGAESGVFETIDVQVYHDRFSAAPPIGNGLGGYQIFFKGTTSSSVSMTLKDLTRMNDLY